MLHVSIHTHTHTHTRSIQQPPIGQSNNHMKFQKSNNATKSEQQTSRLRGHCQHEQNTKAITSGVLVQSFVLQMPLPSKYFPKTGRHLVKVHVCDRSNFQLSCASEIRVYIYAHVCVCSCVYVLLLTVSVAVYVSETYFI